MPRHSPYALIRLNFLLNFLQLFSLNCLSFIEHLFWFSFRSKKVWSFLRFFFPSGWDITLNLGNCSSLPKLIGKTYSNLFCLLKCVLFYLFVSTHFTSLFGFQWTFSLPKYFCLRWWAQVDSNHRPRAYQARALTTWAMSPLSYFDVSRLSRLLFTAFLPLVEMMGFEPMTPCLQGRCSPNWATPPYWEVILTVTENWTTKIEALGLHRAPFTRNS